jgi:hypothetical protein
LAGKPQSYIWLKGIWRGVGEGRQGGLTDEKPVPRPLASPKNSPIQPLSLTALELAHLVHKRLQARPGVGLFLAVVGQVEEGNVVVVFPKELE